jgi:hypothetical protein
MFVGLPEVTVVETGAGEATIQPDGAMPVTLATAELLGA